MKSDYTNICLGCLSATVVQAFQESTKDGSHRFSFTITLQQRSLVNYIIGNSLFSSTGMPLFFLASLLFSGFINAFMVQTSHRRSSSFVKLFLSSYYKGTPPQPNPELHLLLEKWRAKCTAVRKFSGLAKDDNISEEVEALRNINWTWYLLFIEKSY